MTVRWTVSSLCGGIPFFVRVHPAVAGVAVQFGESLRRVTVSYSRHLPDLPGAEEHGDQPENLERDRASGGESPEKESGCCAADEAGDCHRSPDRSIDCMLGSVAQRR